MNFCVRNTGEFVLRGVIMLFVNAKFERVSSWWTKEF